MILRENDDRCECNNSNLVFSLVFFSVFGSFTAMTYWKIVCEMVNGNVVIDYDVKGIMKKQWKGTCLILSGRLPNAYQSLLYQKC